MDMPTCDPGLISPILCAVNQKIPRNILEIGVGTGKWGMLVREYLDVWYRKSTSFDPLATGAVVLDGIEIHEGYRNPLWSSYNSIIIGDACDLLPLMTWHDLILCIEVLEHLDRKSGKALMTQALRRCSTLIISYTNSPQGPAFNNEHERHLSMWSEEDLREVCPSTRKLISINRVTEVFCMESSSRSVNIPQPGGEPVQ